MALRDLGYRAYEGQRTAHSRNTWTMMRHGLTRAWASWMVKVVAFIGWVPAVAFLAIIAFYIYVVVPQLPEEVRGEVLNPPALLHYLFVCQMWVATLITTGAGAGVIAEDMTYGAFQFYFAKPVAPWQYLAGRTMALATWMFSLTFIPAALLVFLFAGSAEPELRFEYGGLILPSFVYAVFLSAIMSATAVGVSALGRSRSLTMAVWMMVLVIPLGLALMVERITDWPWLHMTSIMSLCWVVGDALFKLEEANVVRRMFLGTELGNGIKWFYAAPALLAVAGGTLYSAYRRIRTAKVIA